LLHENPRRTHLAAGRFLWKNRSRDRLSDASKGVFRSRAALAPDRTGQGRKDAQGALNGLRVVGVRSCLTCGFLSALAYRVEGQAHSTTGADDLLHENPRRTHLVIGRFLRKRRSGKRLSDASKGVFRSRAALAPDRTGQGALNCLRFVGVRSCLPCGFLSASGVSGRGASPLDYGG
jgi:hypothetical protein